MENKILYRITIRGRVQGVGYRWSAVNEAISRGIAGFVKNMSDGSVYIEAEGYREQLDPYVEWCRKGPRASIVRSLDIETSSPEGYDDFRIEH
jgi:acylphosphatase